MILTHWRYRSQNSPRIFLLSATQIGGVQEDSLSHAQEHQQPGFHLPLNSEWRAQLQAPEKPRALAPAQPRSNHSLPCLGINTSHHTSFLTTSPKCFLNNKLYY